MVKRWGRGTLLVLFGGGCSVGSIESFGTALAPACDARPCHLPLSTSSLSMEEYRACDCGGGLFGAGRGRLSVGVGQRGRET
jgi:hypothetical protein